MLTVFTPTYNRAHTLPRLYESLLAQDCKDFEWLVIDDGSEDGTKALFDKWEAQDNGFPVRVFRVENGGKQRAINRAVELARGEYFFIVDSDDALTPDAVSFVLEAFDSLPADPSFIGISGVRGDMQAVPFGGGPSFGGKPWVDASNIERPRYGLCYDMAEVFFTEKLKRYPFPVWPGEKFTSEAVVWDRMAYDGYKLRWFDKVIYRCEYLPGGLTDSFWKILKENPMGYAMLFDVRLLSMKGLINRLKNAIEFDAYCILAGELSYISKSCFPVLTIVLFPAGFLFACLRKRQFARFIAD